MATYHWTNPAGIAEHFERNACEELYLARISKTKRDKEKHIASAATWKQAAEVMRNSVMEAT